MSHYFPRVNISSDSMKFRTEIEVTKWSRPLDYSHKILCLGSCFARNIAEILERNKFRVTASPTGTLFNPASIAATMRLMSEGYSPQSEDIVELDGAYLSYKFHSDISAGSPEALTAAASEALERGGRDMRESDTIIITLGTAWVYRLAATGEVVANCHKQPQRLFGRELLTVAECEALIEEMLSLTTSRIVLTLSPVRHVGECLEDNSLSKAILRVAIANICRRHPERTEYFPSFEMLIDDLRDYRFYGDDLVHPSRQAIEYIAEHFFEAALTPRAKEQMQQVRAIIRAVGHRPRNPQSESYRAFLRQQIAAMDTLPDIDFSAERTAIERAQASQPPLTTL